VIFSLRRVPHPSSAWVGTHEPRPTALSSAQTWVPGAPGLASETWETTNMDVILSGVRRSDESKACPERKSRQRLESNGDLRLHFARVPPGPSLSGTGDSTNPLSKKSPHPAQIHLEQLRRIEIRALPAHGPVQMRSRHASRGSAQPDQLPLRHPLALVHIDPR
jgi:hypothetical protein